MRDDNTFTARYPDGRRVTLRVKRDIDKLDDLDPLERLPAMMKMFPSPPKRSFNAIMAEAEAMAKAADDDDGRNVEAGDDGGGGGGGASNHALSRLADLTVESGKFSSRAEALNWLISHPNGHAFTRLHKAAETAKDTTMSTESLESILKDFGPVKLCKHIVETGRSPCGEFELVAALSKRAAEQFNMPSDRAFARLYESEESVRRACQLAKAAAPYFDPQVQVVGGAEAFDVDDPSEALDALHRIGRERWPDASEAVRFTRAFEANPELARKAHVRPRPPAGGAYAWPVR